MDKKILVEIERQKELMCISEQSLKNVLGGLPDIMRNAFTKAALQSMLDLDDSDLPDLSKGDKDLTITSGKIKHNYTGKAGDMVNRTIKEMEKMGITNPYTQIGILSVIGKESGFTSVKEISYCSTSDSRIVKVFGNRGSKCKSLKCNDAKFFDCVYGVNSGMKLGNTEPGDGWKYVGRGLNGITGRANYRKYGQLIGVDLESNPQLLENPDVSAKAAIMFFLNGKNPKSLPDFKDKESAAKYFADINAGHSSPSARTASLQVAPRFDIA